MTFDPLGPTYTPSLEDCMNAFFWWVFVPLILYFFLTMGGAMFFNWISGHL